MTPEQAISAAGHAAQAVTAANNGDAIGTVAHALDAVLELVPAEKAKQMLDDRARARAEAFREALNDAKFGPKP